VSFEACGPKLAGLLEDLLWGPFLNNPPLLQAIDPVAVLDRDQPVGDDNHGLLALEAAVSCFPCQVEEKSRISTKLKLDNLKYDAGNLRNIKSIVQ
jgi:hypothetical protein